MTQPEFDDADTVPHRFADLWRTVLVCAIQDALIGVQMNGTKADKIKATYQARDYILNYSRDFNEVCSLAGLDPEAVRERVIPQIEAAPTPELLFADRKPIARHHRPRQAPGVVADLSASKGTGAGSTAQESAQIDFHEKATAE